MVSVRRGAKTVHLITAKPQRMLLAFPVQTLNVHAHHRSGVLSTQLYSIALGGSRCLQCTSKYTFAWLTVVFAVAGIALVTLLLVCNVTISAGTLNGLIFYANVVSTSDDTLSCLSWLCCFCWCFSLTHWH